jgi:hypothetical protein
MIRVRGGAADGRDDLRIADLLDRYRRRVILGPRPVDRFLGR